MDYENLLSKKAQVIKPSGIRKFFDMLDEMPDAISLTVGQPDFVTPWHIREAAIKSLEDGKTYYTSNSGLAALRAEISEYLKRRFDLEYSPENEIIVTIGGSEAIDLAIRSVVDPGDEVILVSPCFVCYEPLISMAGGVTVPLETKEKDKFKLTAQALEEKITDKTKMVILPFPNNPTGGVMTKDDLKDISDLLSKKDIFVLSDEIYAELTYGFRHTSIASMPGMRERTIVINGFSKAYAMTGWRMGYVCAPKEITKQMYKIHQFGIMCAPTTSQYAAIEALQNGDEDIEYMAGQYNIRRKLITNGLRSIGLHCFEPEGAFYVFPNISGFGMTSSEFCEKLLFEHGVAIVPGNAFGECGEGFARISYAYSVKHINLALKKIKEFVDSIK